MLFEGWDEAKIVAMLPEAPRDPVLIAAHWRSGHPECDKDALTVVAVGTMRDARKAYELAFGKLTKTPKFGATMTKALEMRLKGLDFLARLHGHMRQDDAPSAPGQITNNVINLAIEADPELVLRIADSVREVAPPKVQIRLRKKEQVAIETTAKKTDAAA